MKLWECGRVDYHAASSGGNSLQRDAKRCCGMFESATIKRGMNDRKDLKTILSASADGDSKATEEFVGLLYEELRERAARQLRKERADHTLQPTALVNEVYLRLKRSRELDLQGETHFFALASRAMRRILIDYARRRKPIQRLTLDGFSDDVEALEVDVERLNLSLQEFSEIDARAAQVVELRFFSGLTERQIADQLEVSERTVRADWAMARAWLRTRLQEP